MTKRKKERSEEVTLTLPTYTLKRLEETATMAGLSIDLLVNAILTLHVVREAQRIKREEEGWI